MLLLLGLALCSLLGSSFGAVEIIQNGTYILEYTKSEDNMTLSVSATVMTLGWVGVGLSPTGGMPRSDIIIGGVTGDGTGYIADYFAFNNSRPIEDAMQNIEASTTSENATHTVITFTRLVNTGDDEEDVALEDATHIIWAYGETDELSYHEGINRGSIPLMM